MKKLLLILCASVLALVSCEKQPIENPANEGSEIVFDLNATLPDGADTKAVKSTWETGDVIFVFFSKQAAPKYLEMKWNGSSWVSTAKNSLSLAEDETGTMRAFFLPFGSGATVSADGTNFKFDDTYETYYLHDTKFYSVTGGVVSGTFVMGIPDGYVQFFLDDAGATPGTEIELREPNLTPQGIASIAADGTITHTTPVHGAPLKGYVYDKENKTGSDAKGWLFSGVLAAGAQNTSTDYHFTLVSGAWNTGSYYHKVFTGKTLQATGSTDRAVKLPALSSWTPLTDYKPIDLGCEILVGSEYKRIYWASRNLGATADGPANSNTTYGDYYAWGELAPYYEDGHAYDASPGTWKSGKGEGYAWASYRWGNYDALAKYNSTDGLTVLEAVDDVASTTVPPVGRWRIPTEAEWNALRGSNYTQAWDGTNKGYTVTRKADTGPCSGRSIFLPAADHRSYKNLSNPSTEGYYWSSSIYTSNLIRANYLHFTSSGFGMSNELRFSGMSVRPVME